MRNETLNFYSRYPGQSWKNILSIGDMRYEHDALQEVTFTRDSPQREQIRTKLLRTSPNPAISQMAASLLFGKLFLPAFVHFNGDLDINFNTAPESRLNQLAEALQMPELKLLDVPK